MLWLSDTNTLCTSVSAASNWWILLFGTPSGVKVSNVEKYAIQLADTGQVHRCVNNKCNRYCSGAPVALHNRVFLPSMRLKWLPRVCLSGVSLCPAPVRKPVC